MQPSGEDLIQRDEIDFQKYIFLFRAYAWLLVVATVVFAAAAFIGSRFITPVYQATTTILIDEAASTDIADFNALLTSERRARTYAQLLTEQPVLEGTIERLGLAVTVEALRERVEARRVPDTQLIEIIVEHEDPAMAANIANTIVAVFTEQTEALQASRYEDTKQSLLAQLADLERQIEETNTSIDGLGDTPEDKQERDRLEALLVQYRQSYTNLLQSYEAIRISEAQAASNVIPVNPATPPEKPVRPNVLLNTAVAGFLGLMMAVSLLFIRELLDNTIKTPDDVTHHLGLPILGMIAHIEARNNRELLVTASHPRAPTAEAFRTLRTNIQYASVDRPLRQIVVTSASPEDGKSTVASNLAVAIAQNNRRVTLVEGDLRHPVVHRRMGVSNDLGLAGLFVGPTTNLNSVLQPSYVPGLSVLASGGTPPNPSELLDSERARQIIEAISSQADIVIIDAPPVMAVADAVILSSHADGVLLVVRVGKTRIAACKQAVEQLRRVGANVIGVVLTSIDVRSARYGYYYQYYSYYGRYSEVAEEELAGHSSGPVPTPVPVASAAGGVLYATSAAAVGPGGYATVPAAPTVRTAPLRSGRHRSKSVGGGFSMKGLGMAMLGACLGIGGVGVSLLGSSQMLNSLWLGIGVSVMGGGLLFSGISRMMGWPALGIGLIVAGLGAVAVGAIYLITGVMYLQSGHGITGGGLAIIGGWLMIIGLGTVVFGFQQQVRSRHVSR